MDPTSDERQQPWKTWLTEEISKREEASRTDQGRDEQEQRRLEYLTQMTEQEKLGRKGASNKAGKRVAWFCGGSTLEVTVAIQIFDRYLIG
ncbi:hypothetical protein K458DRAFT_430609 [Lentithecium fluviatile CBS 122367]|uniref:Uncharacterized protein n=1 Tax=Lentithecium fluviatile CBS 122367 TaxID=1168545 RepID=A0A6G1J5Y0_9PLEO|nr:hypothetical protein K458DRAFT_430609 [Lentithecium fluviatile CBS 122367]